MRARLRDQAGFGMLELVIAITMLNIGILAIVAAFNSTAVSIRRASKVSNAAVLAETQMELFRGMKYDSIAQDCTEWNSAIADSSYTADTAYVTNLKPAASSPYWTSPKAPVATVTSGSCTTASPWPAATSSTTICPATGSPATVPAACDPSRVTTGADGGSYRIDTYLYFDQPTGGGTIKVVTVVVRDATKTSRSLARLSSTFDTATGS